MKRSVVGVASVVILVAVFVGFFSIGGVAQTGVELYKTPSFRYVCLHHVGSHNDHQKMISEFFKALETQKISFTGPLMGVYYDSPANTAAEKLRWEIGCRLDAECPVASPLEIKYWDEQQVARCVFKGPYEKMAEAYEAIFGWMYQNGYKLSGPMVNLFIDDPAKVAPAELRTEYWVPVAKAQ
jgi:effector-binding domain-containing protein